MLRSYHVVLFFYLARFKDGKPYNANYERRAGNPTFSKDGQVVNIKSILPDDKGIYMCVATNQYGKINHTIEVDPVGKLRYLICDLSLNFMDST